MQNLSQAFQIKDTFQILNLKTIQFHWIWGAKRLYSAFFSHLEKCVESLMTELTTC